MFPSFEYLASVFHNPFFISFVSSLQFSADLLFNVERIPGATASNAALTLRHYMQKRIKSLQSLLL